MSSSEDQTPEFLAVGHITRDLLPDGGWRLGGTVTFAALAAARLGYRAGILTSAPPDLLAAFAELAPQVAVTNVPTETATTFENIYRDGARRQFLRGQARHLTPDMLPAAWAHPRIVLLGPVAREVAAAFAGTFPDALTGATPQGWLRRWDASGAVSPAPLALAGRILPSLDAMVLSREDVLPLPEALALAADGVPRGDAEAGALIADWARQVPVLAVTRGRDGATLYRRAAAPRHVSAYPAIEVDPTGAGDVFAAAFLCALADSGEPGSAADFASRVAAYSVEHPGASGIPTRAEVEDRWGR